VFFRCRGFFSVLASKSSAINSVPPNKSIYLSICCAVGYCKYKKCLTFYRTHQLKYSSLARHKTIASVCKLKFYTKLFVIRKLRLLLQTCSSSRSFE